MASELILNDGAFDADNRRAIAARLAELVSTSEAPSSPKAEGKPGSIAWDDNYLYVCVADGEWKRIGFDVWSGAKKKS